MSNDFASVRPATVRAGAHQIPHERRVSLALAMLDLCVSRRLVLRNPAVESDTHDASDENKQKASLLVRNYLCDGLARTAWLGSAADDGAF